MQAVDVHNIAYECDITVTYLPVMFSNIRQVAGAAVTDS